MDSEEKHLIALIKRVLCAHVPVTRNVDEVLPALTSSSQLDIQLYGFIAILIRDYIQSWYARITPDHEFIDEILDVIAHCTLSLEKRFRQLDLETLLLDEIPALLENHVKDYRIARERQSTAIFPYATVNDIFHSIQPHPALATSPESERLHLKIITNGLLSAIIPGDDVSSDCERILIREILSNVGLRNLIERLSEPYMLFDIIAKGATALTATGETVKAASTTHTKSTEIMNFLQNGPTELGSKRTHIGRFDLYQIALNTSQLLENSLIFIPKLAILSRHAVTSIVSSWRSANKRQHKRRKSILQMSWARMISTIFSFSKRQPWALGMLQLLGKFVLDLPPGNAVDSYLSQVLHETVVNEASAAKILSITRTTLFPNGSLAPPRSPPTEDEKVLVQKQAELVIWNAMPKVLKAIYFSGGPDQQIHEISESLAFLRSRSCNKHLIYQILDLVVSRLVPEMLENIPSLI